MCVYVCIYVCMYVCIYVYMYVCMYMYVCVYVCVCMYVYMYISKLKYNGLVNIICNLAFYKQNTTSLLLTTLRAVLTIKRIQD